VAKIVLWFRPEDYGVIKAMVPDGPDFHPTFDEWQQASIQRVAQLESRGNKVQLVFVDPQEFARWCEGSGVDHNVSSLNAFAVIRGRKENEAVVGRISLLAPFRSVPRLARAATGSFGTSNKIDTRRDPGRIKRLSELAFPPGTSP